MEYHGLNLALSVVTNGSGTVTTDLTPFGFPVAPFVQLTPVNATTGAALIANVTSVSATSLVVQVNNVANAGVATTVLVQLTPQ